MDRKTLDTVLRDHERWLAGKGEGQRAELNLANLTDMDLQGANLAMANLVGTKLDGAALQGVNFEEADLTGASLREAELQEAILTRARLTGANLERATLTSARMSDINATRARLTGAELQGADLEGGNFMGAQFQGAHLENAFLRGATLTEASFQGAHLHGAGLGRIVAPGVDFQGAQFQGAQLIGANLREAGLARVNLEDADLRTADLENADLRGASLDRAALGGAKLREANLEEATAREADLHEADMGRANLKGVDFERATLAHATLEGADMERAWLAEADFYKANVHNAKLDTQVNLILTRHQEWADDKGGWPATFQEAELVGAYQQVTGVEEQSALAYELYQRVQRAEEEARKEGGPRAMFYDGQLAADFRPPSSRWETIKATAGEWLGRMTERFSRSQETESETSPPPQERTSDERVGKQVLLFPTQALAKDAGRMLPESYKHEVQPVQLGGGEELYAVLASRRGAGSERSPGADQSARPVRVSVFASEEQAESYGQALASSHEYEVQHTMMGNRSLYTVLASPCALAASQDQAPAASPSPASQASRDPAKGQHLAAAGQTPTYAEGRAACERIMAHQEEVTTAIAGIPDPADRAKAERLFATVRREETARQRTTERDVTAEPER